MVARQVNLAGGDQKTAMNQVDRTVCQVSGEIRTVISAAVLLQPSCDKDLGKTVSQCELDVWICLVVAQKNVEARLLLLDEIVLESQRLALVFDNDVLHVDGFAHQRAGFCILCGRFQQLRTHSRAQVLGLADVDHAALAVAELVDARRLGDLTRAGAVRRGVGHDPSLCRPPAGRSATSGRTGFSVGVLTPTP